MHEFKPEILDALEEAGLSRTESIIYLSILKKGQSTAYKIAKESGLYKANTYQAIEGLIKKNLATQIIIDNKNIIKVLPPEELISKLDRQKEKMQSILPMIERGLDEEPEGISLHVGVPAFMNILYSLLKLGKEIYVYDIPSYVPEMVKNYIMQFHKERIKHKVSMYHIYDYDTEERIKFLNKMKYTYAKRGKINRQSRVSTMTCGDVSLIINWKDKAKTIQIKDKDVAEAYKGQFDILWKL